MAVVSDVRAVAMSMIAPTQVDWRQETGRLHIRYEHTDGRHIHTERVQARAVLDLDDRGQVLDVDIKGLPRPVVQRLAPFAGSRVTENSGPGVSLDADAAWLWLHLRRGPRAEQLRGDAQVDLTFLEGALAEIALTLLPTQGHAAEMSS
ncbi:hypothetical protein AB0F13_05730 [Streptomyces sp. NPDC026206]|uniref:hypothetical protein n=1 Tax=Streptomyces sp. NPDC026206 TaxID=3157089 RepID=UPI0033F4542A